MPRARRPRRYATKHRRFLDTFRPLYDDQLAFQGGGCAICGRLPSPDRRLDIDHDHKLMIVRGLLCVRCNRALPMWITADWLRIAADYLADPPAQEFLASLPKPEGESS